MALFEQKKVMIQAAAMLLIAQSFSVRRIAYEYAWSAVCTQVQFLKRSTIQANHLRAESGLKNMTASGRFEALSISLAPLAAFILLYVIDPELMKPLISTAWGWLAVGIAALLVGIGYYILIKITTIEV